MTTLLGLVFGCGIAASQTPRAEQTMNSKRQYIAEERRNYHPLPELLRKLSVTHYIIVYFAILPKLRYHQLCRMTNR